MRIAVDAMGGDRAPEEILYGVSDAVEAGFIQPDEIVLIGQEPRVAPLIHQCPTLKNVAFHHASEVVEMGDSPTGTLRNKPDSSIQVALRLVQSGEAGAFVSAGNTGAVVASAWALLGRLPGVRRPGIAVTFNSLKGPVTILDVGANIHCKPLHLFQYGVMADVFSRDILKVEAPKIALLNIGEEEKKGNTLVKETREYFDKSPLNFVGFIEGTDLLSGDCDVVVCEGFVGNVVLKVMEGVGAFLLKSFAGAASSESSGMTKDVMGLASRLDYAEYGGAPLLGVNGLTMIMHGRSDRRATSNACRVARQFIVAQVNEHIRAAMESALSQGATQEEAR